MDIVDGKGSVSWNQSYTSGENAVTEVRYCILDIERDGDTITSVAMTFNRCRAVTFLLAGSWTRCGLPGFLSKLPPSKRPSVMCSSEKELVTRVYRSLESSGATVLYGPKAVTASKLIRERLVFHGVEFRHIPCWTHVLNMEDTRTYVMRGRYSVAG